MNDKIQQLIKQANREIGEQLGQSGVYLNFGPAKYFAELIVKECADVCRKEWLASSSAQRYGDQCADSIEHHFNIKETV